jgi:hypothetical protein
VRTSSWHHSIWPIVAEQSRETDCIPFGDPVPFRSFILLDVSFYVSEQG